MGHAELFTLLQDGAVRDARADDNGIRDDVRLPALVPPAQVCRSQRDLHDHIPLLRFYCPRIHVFF